MRLWGEHPLFCWESWVPWATRDGYPVGGAPWGSTIQAGAPARSLFKKKLHLLVLYQRRPRSLEGRPAWSLEPDEEIFFSSAYQLRTGPWVRNKHAAVGAKPGRGSAQTGLGTELWLHGPQSGKIHPESIS